MMSDVAEHHSALYFVSSKFVPTKESLLKDHGVIRVGQLLEEENAKVC